MKTGTAVFAMALFLLFSGCTDTTVDREAEAPQADNRRSELATFFENLASAAVAGDTQAYTSHFRPDGTLLLPHRPPIIGRSAIGDFFEDFRTVLELQIDVYEQQDIEIVGDVAMVRSRSTGHYLNKKTGHRYPYDQKYLDILHYENGQWQMYYHMASNNVLDDGVWETGWEPQ